MKLAVPYLCSSLMIYITLNQYSNTVEMYVVMGRKKCKQESILSKASQILGLTKRTCHFVTNSNRKRTLYLTLVRIMFEHCVTV